MKIPKNVVQIGTVDSGHKLYIEDYVHIFLKQYGKETAEFYLYGQIKKEGETVYYFVYGAAKQETGWDIMEKRYFADMERIGEAASDGKEIWMFLQDGYSVALENYFVFYEQNNSMQSYLIEMHQNRPGEKDIIVRPRTAGNANAVQEQEKPEKNIAQEEEKKGTGNSKRAILTAASLFVLCVLGIRAMNYRSELNTVGNFFTITDDTEKDRQSAEEKADEIAEKTETAENAGFYVEENQIRQPLKAETESTVQEAEPVETENFNEILEETEEAVEVISDAVVTQDAPITITTASYTVKKGDNLAAICRAKYGNTDRIQEVIDLNHLSNPNHLYPGQKIILPD